MIIKVCGIRSPRNISQLSRLSIDMVGLNFYPLSKRFIPFDSDPLVFDCLNDSISRVGVFVNMGIEDVMDHVDQFRLDFVQLHGDEGIELSEILSNKVGVIKVFRVGDYFDMDVVKEFSFANYILFDKASSAFGGSGRKFDWSVLQDYNIDVPFILSGGIGPDDVDSVRLIKHPSFIGIDINSRFETQPGVKDIDLIDGFIATLEV